MAALGGLDRSAIRDLSMNVERNIEKYLSGCGDGRGVFPTDREASFGYCFNYFQSFREAGHLEALADAENLETTCLQLGFFLASWGMFRGASFLLRRSAKFYEPLVNVISTTDPGLDRLSPVGGGSRGGRLACRSVENNAPPNQRLQATVLRARLPCAPAARSDGA